MASLQILSTDYVKLAVQIIQIGSHIQEIWLAYNIAHQGYLVKMLLGLAQPHVLISQMEVFCTHIK
jgi:hypothetical protein